MIRLLPDGMLGTGGRTISVEPGLCSSYCLTGCSIMGALAMRIVCGILSYCFVFLALCYL